ncbi:secondary thiamine-phosphate synthase enzyme YjbQ [Acidobacteriia bacterium AH_259_A11_L15]|nr:secondary thiamine-phosphate synthase enzyme YjbQ [Acidobacteriia bacterium AH_259_A11_L15]
MSQKGVETVAPGPGSLNHVNGLRLRAETLTVTTRDRVELVNITELLAEQVRTSGIRDGLVLVNSLHTTLALFINEFQAALLDDIRSFLERVVVQGDYYKHNDPELSDCDRFNAHAHLRAMLLGHNLALQVQNGELVLGTFQSVILAELDGPRERSLQLQILGAA